MIRNGRQEEYEAERMGRNGHREKDGAGSIGRNRRRKKYGAGPSGRNGRKEKYAARQAGRSGRKEKYAARQAGRSGMREQYVAGRSKADRAGELPDYGVYQASFLEILQIIGEYCLLDFGVSILFYNSWMVFMLFLPGFVIYYRSRKKMLLKQQFSSMHREFLDGMQFTATALSSGYAMENAFSEALTELRKIYPEDSFIVKEFHQIAVQIKMNVPIERLLDDFARRSHIDDIRNFADVFYTARRTGGDMIAIVRNTASNMRQKEETLLEIETVLSGKMMEQRIMSVIPLAILAYVRLTDPAFLAGMYHTGTGILIMTVCLIVYVIAYLWGRSIMDIEV